MGHLASGCQAKCNNCDYFGANFYGNTVYGSNEMNRRAQGLRSWIWQRISAIYIALVILLFFVSLLRGTWSSYHQWHEWVANPVISIILVMFFLMVFIHAWVGVRDVILDHVKPLCFRAAVLLLASLGLGFCLIWSLRSLLMTVLT